MSEPYNPHSGYAGCKRPDPNCPHEWNAGLCMKCLGYHDCNHFMDDLCVSCGAMT